MPETTPDFKLLFESAPLLILVLTPDLKVLAGTDNYFASTLTKRDEIKGMLVYDVFPDNPNDPNPTGVANLKASFNRVLQNKVPDVMGRLKYDVPLGDGTFEARHWSVMNTPVLDAHGNIQHIINQVVDITDYVVAQEKGEHFERLSEELTERAKNMEAEIYLRVQQLQAANEKMAKANGKLQATQEELQAANEEMQAAHEELRAQQEEMAELNARMMETNDGLEETAIALQLKTEELERSNSFKTDFLSNMSHELRTPLNSMLILSKLLSNNSSKNLTPKQVEQAAIIYKAGTDLLTLINDILDLTKIEAGKIEMEMEKISTASIIESLENTFAPAAAQKEIVFEISVQPGAPEFVYTDKFRLEQILKNLLSNAFKFTDAGGRVSLEIGNPPVGTRLTQHALHGDTDVVMFAVSDTGIGIPADKQAVIFDAFKQVDGSTSRKYGGTGLGLSISKQLAGLLGGEVQLQSQPGAGSTFSVYLPAAYSMQQPGEEKQRDNAKSALIAQYQTIKPETIPAAPAEGMAALLTGKCILMVDDDERNLTALTMVLQGYGPRLLHAANGRQALELLESNEVGLVLMDIMMPEMDGYEAVKHIRQNNRYKKLPVIMMAAKSIKPDFDKGLLSGASDYLQKPLDIAYLFSLLQVWLQPANNN